MRQVTFRRGGEVRIKGNALYVEQPGPQYDPMAEPVEAELAKLLAGDRDPKSVEHARAFVARYGVLAGETNEGAYVKLDDLRLAAADLRNVYSVARLLQLRRSSSAKARREADIGLRRWANEHGHRPSDAPDVIAATVDAHLESARRVLSPTESGFEWSWAAGTLLGLIYTKVGDGIARGDRVDICENRRCRKLFLVTDERMRFCSPRCRKEQNRLRDADLLKKARAQ